MRLLVFLITTLLSTASIDAHAEFLNRFDISNLTVSRSVLSHGGPQRDGIPSIDAPNYVLAKEAHHLDNKDIVLAYLDGEQAYAYPRYILNWHEIVNENGFVIVYCPLCGSGTAFSNIIQGQRYEFGVSGLLYNSDVVLYDRQTESLWSQLDSLAIAGKLVGTKLTQLPLETTTWEQWKSTHPDTKVLSESQGVKRNYRHDPYTGYETSEILFFNVLRQAPKDYHTKEWVLGVEVDGIKKAYPYSELRKQNERKFEDTIGGETIYVFWNADGNTAHATEVDGTPLVTTTAFWFAWYNFHPETLIFKSSAKHP